MSTGSTETVKVVQTTHGVGGESRAIYRCFTHVYIAVNLVNVTVRNLEKFVSRRLFLKIDIDLFGFRYRYININSPSPALN